MFKAKSTNQPAPWLYLIGCVAWTWFFMGLTLLTNQSYLAIKHYFLELDEKNKKIKMIFNKR